MVDNAGARATPRDPGEPLDVSRIAANLPFVVRTVLGMAGLAVGASIVGVGVVILVNVATTRYATHHQLTVLLIVTLCYVAFSVLVGVTLGAMAQRRTLRWLLRGDPPSAEDARRALRMPFDLGVLTIALWALGALVMGSTAAAVGEDASTVVGLAGGTALAGLAAAGLTYLLTARANERVALLALAAQPPRDAPPYGLRQRLLLSWALTTATPIVGLLLVLAAPHGRAHVVGTSIVVAVVALVVSGLATALFSRAVGQPLRGMVAALRQVGEGDLEASVTVDDAGEIGLLQNGFNDMVSGLRERERIQDLFGRHVGTAVAQEAITGGVTMAGEQREVVALFVDITGSTRLTRETEPKQFVKMLNRFFEIVVDEVESSGGLLNKFEGDAALCVFGAPVELADPATDALQVARTIRDRVAEMAEFEIGIGVASGPVIAGQIGAASRLEYTVIGDAVNEAARLTEQAKRVPGRILASAATFDAAAEEEREHWVPGRTVRLRGRERPTSCYRTVDDPYEIRRDRPALARRLSDVARVVADLPGDR